MSTRSGHIVPSNTKGETIWAGTKANKLRMMAEIAASVTAVCPECGKTFKDVKRHMERVHGD